MSNDLYEALGKEAWMRGMWLGFALVIVFALGAGFAFLLTLLIGWSTSTRLLVALLVGPIFGVIAFWIYWRVKKPVIGTLNQRKES